MKDTILRLSVSSLGLLREARDRWLDVDRVVLLRAYGAREDTNLRMACQP